MTNTIRDYLQQLKKKRSQKRRTSAVLFLLSLVVAAGVMWQLHITGASMTGDTYCGYEEHTHGDSCMKKQLVCGQEESEGHTHTDACYETQQILTCAQAEHVHSEEAGCYQTQQVLTCIQAEHTHSAEDGCYDADGNLICQTSEHTHTDACYETQQMLVCAIPEHMHSSENGCYTEEKVLICGQEESEGHTHTDACYEEVLSCDKTEHVHTLACYSDKTADVETSDKWEATLPGSLSGSWGEDVASVAKSQLGYTESTKNYEVDADGTTKNGYTRYGSWYGQPYADWNVMFASFCIHYAGIDRNIFPYDVNIQSWISRLNNMGLYTADSSAADVGDVAFYENTAGIVTAVSSGNLTVISGDADGAVKTQSIGAGSVSGVGLVPENPAQKTAEEADEESTETSAEEAEEENEATPAEKVTEKSAEAPAEEAAEKTTEESTEASAEETTEEFSEASTEEIVEESTEDPAEETAEESTETSTEETAGEATIETETETRYSGQVEKLLAADEEFVSLWNQYVVENADSDDAEAFEAYIDSLETEDVETWFALTTRVDNLINNQINTLPDTNPTDLGTYLDQEITLADGTKAKRGSVTLELLNADNTVVPKNDAGNYEVEIGKDYKVQFAVSAPYGMEAGTYTYQLPTGITYTATAGEIKTTDGTVIGTWSVDDTGKVTFVFNDAANNAQDLQFNFTAPVAFGEEEKEIPFDGDIKIDIKKTSEKTGEETAHLYKSGKVQDDGSIRWNVELQGNSDNKLVGTVVKDTVDITTQTISKQDITLYVYDLEYFTVENSWNKYVHKTTISQNDITWLPDDNGNITGWEYTVPETINCESTTKTEHNHTENPYTIHDTSRLVFQYATQPDTESGTYSNTAEWGERKTTSNVTSGTEKMGIVKNGTYDAEDNVYRWTVDVTLPAQNGKALWYPFISDTLTVRDGDNISNILETLDNNPSGTYQYDVTGLKNITITATVNGKTYEVPRSTETDKISADTPYIWHNGSYKGSDGKGHLLVQLMKQCDCTEDTCGAWYDGECYVGQYKNDKKTINGVTYCHCFDNSNPIIFTITYEKDASEIINKYGGLDDLVLNKVYAQHRIFDSTSPTTKKDVTDDTDETRTTIPGVFEKKQLAAPGAGNGWTAGFEVTVNDGFADLSTMENGVTITDQMSNTLVFMSDSLTITATDQDGGQSTLVKDTDYTVNYDSDSHKVTINIPKPGAYQYTLTYGAAINVPTGKSQTYSNKATVTILGHTYTDQVSQTAIADWAASATSYSVAIHKMAKDKTVTTDTGGTKNAPLAGAKFGLFTASGTKMAEGTTGADGNVIFTTDAGKGLTFYPDTAYYIQELQAPDGYNTDETKHWFFFDSGDTVTDPTASDGSSITKYSGTSNAENPMKLINSTGYELPSTGGSGVTPYVLTGLLLITASVVYGYELRRRRGRRSR